MNELDRIYTRAESAAEYAKNYFKHLAVIFERMDCAQIENVIGVFMEAYNRRRKIIFAGNGGSAANASHFVTDFNMIVRSLEKQTFRAFSLAENSAYLTALSNDIGYRNIFVKQLASLMAPKDVFVAISASGNSENLIKAIDFVRKSGGVSVGIAGFDGGEMKRVCDHFIYIPTENGEYGPAEDVALILDHLISTYLAFRVVPELIGLVQPHEGYLERLQV